MQKARDDFDKRALEINSYFHFLENVDKDRPILHFEKFGEPGELRIDDELLKVLKASGFLLLYNLVESITRLALTEYLNVINDANVAFENLNESLQKLWIKNRKFREINPGSISETEYLHKVYNEIVTNSLNTFILEVRDDSGKVKKEFIAFSGNVDVKLIKTEAIKYGITLTVDREIYVEGVKCLTEVKTKRNDLTHGRTSFADSTKNCSVQEPQGYKDGVLEYLGCVLSNIEECIRLGKFKR